MFKLAYIKLTLVYVAILMLISISFSVVIYEISSSELNNGFNRQARVLRDIPGNPMLRPVQDLENIRLDQLNESNSNLRLNLIYANLVILILGTGLSYFLARRTFKPLEDAMIAQNRFTADASHELRTPLTAMKTEIEVDLRDKDLKLDEAKKLLKSNLEEIHKLESLSNALLILAKFEDNFNLDFKKLALDEIIKDALKKVLVLAQTKKIKFQTNLKKIKITGDYDSLLKVVVILLDNAIKYSFNQSKILVKMRKGLKFVEIKIIDYGVGIKNEDLPHIFDRFYRADTSRSKNKTNGYGLGLAIAKRIIEMHQGMIIAESRYGKGSTFIVKLPFFKKVI